MTKMIIHYEEIKPNPARSTLSHCLVTDKDSKYQQHGCRVHQHLQFENSFK